MKPSQVKLAAHAYFKGDYSEALRIYKLLARKLGAHLFDANIELCKRQQGLQFNHFSLPESVICSYRKIWHDICRSECVAVTQTDSFIHFVTQMANYYSISNISLIRGRIALVVDHAQSYSKSFYAKRIQLIAKKLTEKGFEVLCFVRPGRPWEIGDGFEEVLSEVNVDGVRYIHSLWPNAVVPKSGCDHLDISAGIFTELYEKYRPEIVVACGDFTSALPAILAAKKMFLPIIKEHLYFGNSFLDLESLSYFSCLNFAQKYALEQVCLKMANRGFYLYPEDSDSWNAFLETINQASSKTCCLYPVVTLYPNNVYTIENFTGDSGHYFLELDVKDEDDGSSKGLVASFRFFDAKGKRVLDNFASFSSSKDYPHYQYVDTSKAKGSGRVLVFSIPDGIRKIEADIVAFSVNRKVNLTNVRIGKVRVEDIARWISLAILGVAWIKAVEAYVHKEGAVSLRLALLNYKYAQSRHPNDLAQLKSAIQEMVELDATWVPDMSCGGKLIKVRHTEKLTVAHLHKTVYPYENTGGAIRGLCTVLSQKRIGIDPYIITPIGYPRSVGILDSKNNELIEGIEHFRIGANIDGLRVVSFPDRTRYSAFHIAKIIKSRGAHVIHAASGVRGYELALQALAVKMVTGLPLLYEVRSFHEHTWTTVRSDALSLEKTKLRVIKENFCMAKADFVTTISQSMKKILIERGVSPDKIQVIPNAIDETKYIEDYKPADISELKGADFVVGYISNMSRREGHQYLIRAIHQVRKITGLDIRGFLVGDGSERENLQHLAASLGLDSVICFPGEVDHSIINSYYKAIDLFVIPRIPDYAADWVTPLKPYEAMALERPLIVTDLPALREIVGDNEERGFIAKPVDVESLVEKLLACVNNPVIRQQKVRAAKEWVFAHCTWSANARRYETIYRRLMAQASSVEKEVPCAYHRSW